MNPYAINGPAVISFSGGRTSGYMLRRILDASLRDDCHVLFANTGKERNETLDFVNECSCRWGVPITWLEYRPVAPRFAVVDYATAARKGEPFDALIRKHGLPTFGAAFCSTELKTRLFRRWMVARGYKHWTSVIGLRADEPRRVSNKRKPTRERWVNAMPLADAGVTRLDVRNFWREQPFDLRLEDHEGNCDLCWKKDISKRHRIAVARPDLLQWWIDKEAEVGSTFRIHEPPYAKLPGLRLPVLADEDAPVACDCHD